MPFSLPVGPPRFDAFRYNLFLLEKVQWQFRMACGQLDELLIYNSWLNRKWTYPMAFGDRCCVLKLWVLKAWNLWELAELEAEVELSWLPDEPETAAHIVSSCWKLPPWLLSFPEQLSSTSSMQRSSLLIASSFKSLRLDETIKRWRADIELPPVSMNWLASAFKVATYGNSGSSGQVAWALHD